MHTQRAAARARAISEGAKEQRASALARSDKAPREARFVGLR